MPPGESMLISTAVMPPALLRLLFIAFVVTVAATALTVRRRPWDAAMVALAPTTLSSLNQIGVVSVMAMPVVPTTTVVPRLRVSLRASERPWPVPLQGQLLFY